MTLKRWAIYDSRVHYYLPKRYFFKRNAERERKVRVLIRSFYDAIDYRNNNSSDAMSFTNEVTRLNIEANETYQLVQLA